MNIEEIEKNIVEKVIKHYSDFSLVKTVISDYTFIEKPSYGYQTLYFKDDKPIILSDNAKISDDVGLLLNLMFKEGRKTNKGTITIYPNGEYESSFIWDEAAYLEKLVFKAENLFSLLYYEISVCPAFHNAQKEPISWQEATVSVSFKSGKVQGLNVVVTTATDAVIHYSEKIKDKFGKSEYQSSRGYYEEIYQMMNEGELKALYPRWNIATIHIKYGVRFDFEKHVILEWREENA